MKLVKALVPDSILKLYFSEQDFRPILQWFKTDFMRWMPKLLKCKRCDCENGYTGRKRKFMEIACNRDLLM